MLQPQTQNIDPDIGMNVLPEAARWSVAWTKSRAEKSLAEYLIRNEVPCFLPLRTRIQKANRQTRTFYLPLFSGYLFYDPTRIDRPKLFESRYVAQTLEPDHPEQLAQELAQLSRALLFDSSLIKTRYAEPGRRVYVKKGPLKGLEGEVVRISGQTRLIIKVSFIGQAAELAIEEDFLEFLL